MPSLPKVQLTQLKSGETGVGIGEERLFLTVRSRGPEWWRFRLIELTGGWHPRSAWISLEAAGDLRTAHKAKVLRDILETEYGGDWREVLELAIGVIQDHQEVWLPQKTEEDVEEDQAEQIVAPEIEAEVDSILESENPLIHVTGHLDHLIAGEKSNKQLLFCLLLSGLSPDPHLKQMILLKGESGAGKSTLMTIADLFKTKSVGRFTRHALDYSDLEKFDVLKLKEVGQLDQESQGVSTLKFLSADDEGYTVEFVTKDPETNQFVTIPHRIPPITVISSTTRVALDPQYHRRNWILNPDESEEQTRRIGAWKARLEYERAQVLLGLREETSREHSKRVLRALIQRLKPISVIVPFPKTLLSILDSSMLRVRGDYRKILSLIKLHALLLQKQVPKVPATNSTALLATPHQALDILLTARDPLTSMTTDIEGRIRNLIQLLEQFNITDCGAQITKTLREQIAVKIGRAERTVRRYLNGGCAAGFMSSDGKRPATYTLLRPLKEIKQKLSAVSAVLESADNLIINMQKEAQIFLKPLLDKLSPGDRENIFQKFHVKDHDGEEKNIPHTPRTEMSNNHLSPEKHLKQKGLTEDRPFPNRPIIQPNSASKHAINLKIEDVLSIQRLSETDYGTCVGCWEQRDREFQITQHNGDWGLLCTSCGLRIQKQLAQN